jgi:hypothetical protein
LSSRSGHYSDATVVPSSSKNRDTDHRTPSAGFDDDFYKSDSHLVVTDCSRNVAPSQSQATDWASKDKTATALSVNGFLPSITALMSPFRGSATAAAVVGSSNSNSNGDGSDSESTKLLVGDESGRVKGLDEDEVQDECNRSS